MKSERIYDSWDKAGPDEAARKRMLEHILEKKTIAKEVEGKRRRKMRILYPAAAVLLIAAGGVITLTIGNTGINNDKLPSYKIAAGDFNVKEDVMNTEPDGQENNQQNTDFEEADAGNDAAGNLGIYFAANGYPDYLGGTYVDELGELVVLLYKDSEAVRSEVESIAGSDRIRFEKAEYSYQYLSSVIADLSEGMVNGRLPFIDSVSLDDKANRIRVNITEAKEAQLYSIADADTVSGGDVFDIYLIDNAGKVQEDAVKNQGPAAKEEEKISVQLKESSISTDQIELTLLITNNTDTDYYYGNDIKLERRGDTGWSAVSMRENAGWSEVAYILRPYDTAEYNVCVSYCFDNLEQGTYRLTKTFNGPDRFGVPVEFEIPAS